MDDSLEIPNAIPIPNLGDDHVDDDEESSGDEDCALDWTKLPSVAPRTVIPKRGEKDFEPKPGGGSGLQLHVLDRARSAMFDALKGTRGMSSKAISYAVWYPGISRAHVTTARGVHFGSMGHSVPRPLENEDLGEKAQKRMELLPEEAIYLIERGALFCWKDSDLRVNLEDGMAGTPMSVQQAYSEMIGKEDLTLERFQVFAYLRRLGYGVTRSNPPTPWYPKPPPFKAPNSTSSILQRVLSLFRTPVTVLSQLLKTKFDWWKPLKISRWLYRDKNYASIFRSLRFLPSGHSVSLVNINPKKDEVSPYQVFFNLYKPSTPFRKSAPPPPDFHVVVINARTTSMPSLHELTALFDVMPELPPPLPRRRPPLPLDPIPEKSEVKTVTSESLVTPTVPFLQRVLSWAFPSPPPLLVFPVRRPNPFMALKAGKKIVVVAVVDAGSISFFRFGEGAFTEWPMI